jgi:hypothetical protein
LEISPHASIAIRRMRTLRTHAYHAFLIAPDPLLIAIERREVPLLGAFSYKLVVDYLNASKRNIALKSGL